MNYIFFFRKRGLTFHANYILWRQFHEMSNLVFWNKPEKNISKYLLISFVDWATGMCNYYFCKHLKSTEEVKVIITPVSLR